jgi:hypothetical protein
VVIKVVKLTDIILHIGEALEEVVVQVVWEAMLF